MSKNTVSIWVAIITALGVIIAAGITWFKPASQLQTVPSIIINNANISRNQASDDTNPPTKKNNSSLVQTAATIQPTLTSALSPPTETTTPVPTLPIPTVIQVPT